jgi:hypothetical protein
VVTEDVRRLGWGYMIPVFSLKSCEQPLSVITLVPVYRSAVGSSGSGISVSMVKA